MRDQAWRRRHRFYRHLCVVTVGLVVMMALPSPVFRVHLVGDIVLQLLLMIELGQPIARHANAPSPAPSDVRMARLYRLFGVIGLLSLVIWMFTPAQASLTGMPLLALLIIFVIWSLRRLLRLLAREQVIGQEVIAGAIAGYLLLGIVGGMMFSVMETVQPGSFTNLVHHTHHATVHPLLNPDLSRMVWDLDYSRLNYYAFVSLTTVGYGDIVPSTPTAEMASVWLAIAGTLYLAVVMGLLISRFTVQTRQEESEQEQTDQLPVAQLSTGREKQQGLR